MKNTLLVSLLSLIFSCKSTSKVAFTLESLGKYSYYIYLDAGQGRYAQASGFFIEKDKKLFLISALHVFSGKLIDSTTQADYPDTLQVRISIEDNKPEFIKINIKSIVVETPAFTNTSTADVYAYPIVLPKKTTVFTVNKFLQYDLERICDKIDTVITVGYPLVSLRTLDSTLQSKAQTHYERLVQNFVCRFFLPEQMRKIPLII